jgi:subfamily B ATP-binding cassette protein MsbA
MMMRRRPRSASASANLDSPTPNPRPDRATLRRLFGLARPYRGRLLLAGVCLLVSSLLSLALPWMIQRLIDSVLVNHNPVLLGQSVLALLAIFIVQAGFNFGYTYQLAFTGERLVADLRRRVFAHLQTLSLAFYDNQRVGELTSRLSNDVTVVQGGLTGNLLGMVQQIVTLIGGLLIIVVTDWRLLVVALLIMPPLMFVGTWFGRRLERTSTLAQAALGTATTVLEETLSAPRVVKAFGREDYEVDRYGAAVEDSFRLAMRRARLRAVFVPLITLLSFGALAAVLWFGGQEVLAGRITPGQLISLMLYMMMVAGPLGGLAGVYAQFQEASGAARRLFELLDTLPTVAEAPGAVALPKPVQGAVTLAGVDFAYGSGPPVLSGIDLAIAPGEVVALVGPSGAGKTTLASLIPRFYDPVAGQVTLDGHDLRRITLKSLRGAIAVVPQDPLLFGGSVRENIAYGRLDATDAEITAAARAANAANFISDLPDGYATIIGERGVKLSGGQRQRIAIARALLRNPAVLILDEATSSLDTESETLVRQALDRLMRGRTVVIIAHRLSTVERADRIVVLDAGRIVEQGTHAELLTHEGLYHRLYTQVTQPPDDGAALPDDLERLLTALSTT